MTPGGGSGRYLIAGATGVLTPLLALLPAVPGTAVVAVSRDGAGAPTRLVVTTDPPRAEALAIALRGAVLVEEDLEVRPTQPAPLQSSVQTPPLQPPVQ